MWPFLIVSRFTIKMLVRLFLPIRRSLCFQALCSAWEIFWKFLVNYDFEINYLEGLSLEEINNSKMLPLLAEELLKCCVAENIVKDVPTPMWEEHLLAGVFGYADGWIPEAQEIFQRYWHLASSCNENSSINRSSQASTICGLLDTAILVEVKHSLLILTLFYHRNEYIPVLTLDWRRHGVTLSIYMYLHLSDKVDACQSQK